MYKSSIWKTLKSTDKNYFQVILIVYLVQLHTLLQGTNYNVMYFGCKNTFSLTVIIMSPFPNVILCSNLSRLKKINEANNLSRLKKLMKPVIYQGLKI